MEREEGCQGQSWTAKVSILNVKHETASNTTSNTASNTASIGAKGESKGSHTFLGNILCAWNAGELPLEARVFGLASPLLAALFRGLRGAGGDLAGRKALRRIIRARRLRRRVPPSLAASGTAAESDCGSRRPCGYGCERCQQRRLRCGCGESPHRGGNHHPSSVATDDEWRGGFE